MNKYPSDPLVENIIDQWSHWLPLWIHRSTQPSLPGDSFLADGCSGISKAGLFSEMLDSTDDCGLRTPHVLGPTFLGLESEILPNPPLFPLLLWYQTDT